MALLTPVLLVLVLAAAPATARACSCRQKYPIEQYVESEAKHAEVLVAGQVEQLRIHGALMRAAPCLRPVEVTIRVKRRWKGPDRPTVVVGTSSLGHGDCGLRFSLGDDYLVSAHRSFAGDQCLVWTHQPPRERTPVCPGAPIPMTAMCGLSRPLAEAPLEDLEQALPAPEPPTPTPTQPPEPAEPYPASGTRPDAETAGAIVLAVLRDGDLDWHPNGEVVPIAESEFTRGVPTSVKEGRLPGSRRISPVLLSPEAATRAATFLAVEDVRVEAARAGIRFRIVGWENAYLHSPAVTVFGEAVLSRTGSDWQLGMLTLSIRPPPRAP